MSHSPNSTIASPYFLDLKARIKSRNPEDVEAIERANADFRNKTVTGAVHTNTALANISIQYANGLYIGDQLLPIVPVTHKSNTYYTYDKRSRLAYPDDELGSRGSPNELNEVRSSATYSCKGYGYKEYVDGETVANQDAPLDELADATANLAEGMAFRRELRSATLLTTSGNYGSNTAAIGASSRWDSAGGGDPIGAIQTARAAIWSGRGPSRLVGFTSLAAMNVLVRHPAILDLFKYGGTSPGLATPTMLAKFFGLDDVLVSDAWKDTANEGQVASYSRIWPDSFGIVRVATSPGIRNASWGYNFRWRDVQTNQWFDQSIGTMGGWYTKVTTNEDAKIVAADTGYLLTTVVG